MLLMGRIFLGFCSCYVVEKLYLCIVVEREIWEWITN